MRGGWIAENSIIAQKLYYKVSHRKGKKGLMLVKMESGGSLKRRSMCRGFLSR